MINSVSVLSLLRVSFARSSLLSSFSLPRLSLNNAKEETKEMHRYKRVDDICSWTYQSQLPEAEPDPSRRGRSDTKGSNVENKREREAEKSPASALPAAGRRKETKANSTPDIRAQERDGDTANVRTCRNQSSRRKPEVDGYCSLYSVSRFLLSLPLSFFYVCTHTHTHTHTRSYLCYSLLWCAGGKVPRRLEAQEQGGGAGRWDTSSVALRNDGSSVSVSVSVYASIAGCVSARVSVYLPCSLSISVSFLLVSL